MIEFFWAVTNNFVFRADKELANYVADRTSPPPESLDNAVVYK